jgi:hypothetical protein
MDTTTPIYVTIVVGAVCLALGLVGSALLRKLKGDQAGNQMSVQAAKVILRLLLVVVGNRAKDVVEAILKIVDTQEKVPAGVTASNTASLYRSLALRDRGNTDVVEVIEEEAVGTALSLIVGDPDAIKAVKAFLKGEQTRIG